MADSPLTIEEITTHTQTMTNVGPDYCDECSESAQAWVKWPCQASLALAERDAARSEVTEMREALGDLIDALNDEMRHEVSRNAHVIEHVRAACRVLGDPYRGYLESWL